MVGLEALVDFGREVLGKRDGRQAVEGAFPSAGDGAAGDDETEGGVETDVDAAEDGIGFKLGRQEVGEGDIDAIGRGAVDRPSRAKQCRGGFEAGGMDRAVAGLGGAGPTLLGFRCDYGDGVAGGEERGDKFVEERAGDAVVVGDEKIHGAEETTKITKDTKKEFAQSGRIG